MTARRLTPALGGAIIATVVIACNSLKTNVLPSPADSVASIDLSGPSAIPPGQSVQFLATLHMTDGTTKPATSEARWISSNASVVRISTTGLATALTAGESVITVKAGAANSRSVLVLPDGTFRVVGFITETSALHPPIPGARVSAGTLTTTADVDGSYRLYGVPSSADLTAAADGYLPATQTLNLTGNVTQNFALTPNGPPLTMAGNYTLAMDANGPCSTPKLPDALSHRQYDATVSQTGTQVNVMLTEPRFRVNSLGLGNHFSGHATTGAITFSLAGFSGYYYLYNGPASYPSVVEFFSDLTVLVPSGTIVVKPNGSVFSSLVSSSSLFRFDAHFPGGNALSLGDCSITGLTFTPR